MNQTLPSLTCDHECTMLQVQSAAGIPPGSNILKFNPYATHSQRAALVSLCGHFHLLCLGLCCLPVTHSPVCHGGGGCAAAADGSGAEKQTMPRIFVDPYQHSLSWLMALQTQQTHSLQIWHIHSLIYALLGAACALWPVWEVQDTWAAPSPI